MGHIEYDSDKLHETLNKLTCIQLRLIVRSLKVHISSSISRLRKKDLIDTIQREIKRPKVWKNLQGKMDGACSYVSDADKSTFLNGSWFNSRPNVEQVIVCRLLRRVNSMANAYEVSYSKLECKRGEKRPKWNLQSDSDCPRGYAITNGKGCCINLSEHMAILDPDVMSKRCDECDDLTDDDRNFLKSYAESSDVELQKLNKTQFTSDTDATLLLGVSAELQKLLVHKLGSLFDDVLEAAGIDDDECDMTSVELDDKYNGMFDNGKSMMHSVGSTMYNVASTVVQGGKFLAYVLLKLFYIVGRVFNWTATGVYNVVIGTVKAGWTVATTLASVGQKIAYFMVANPAQARLILAIAKSVKKGMCRYIGTKLADSKLLAALEHRMKGNHGKLENDARAISSSMAVYARQAKDSSIFHFMVNNGIGLAGVVNEHWTSSTMRDYLVHYQSQAKQYYSDTFGFDDSVLASMKAKANANARMVVAASLREVESDPVTGTMATMWNMFSTATDYVKDSGELLFDAGVHTKMANNLVKSDSFKVVGKKAGRLVGAGLVGLVSGLPVIGGVLGGITNEMAEMAGEAVTGTIADAVQIMVYKADLLKSFQLFIEFIDPDPCLAEMPSVQRQFPHLYNKLKMSKAVVISWVLAYTGATAEEIKESIDAVMGDGK